MALSLPPLAMAKQWRAQELRETRHRGGIEPGRVQQLRHNVTCISQAPSGHRRKGRASQLCQSSSLQGSLSALPVPAPSETSIHGRIRSPGRWTPSKQSPGNESLHSGASNLSRTRSSGGAGPNTDSPNPGSGPDKDRVSSATEASVTEELAMAIDKAMDSEESQALLKDLAAAEERVARARNELEEIERQERKLQELRMELELQSSTDATLVAAEEEVSRLLTTVSAAEEELRLAGAALVEARSGGSSVDHDAERLESVKAGLVAGLAGAAAFLPLTMGRDLPAFVAGVGSVGLSAALLGVTFRYAVRRDSSNVHLKSGVVGAFAFVQALARVDLVFFVERGVPISWDLVAPALIEAGLEGFALLISVLCLDLCIQREFVQPFPSRK